ncbi:hypothetical protein [Bifidobacterium italicum]|uniref:hypothetical protein n=1 Tax=Bifidobacterium italicum TaxID=1960968 RepID=UPI0012FFA0B7|nr:hypothetical protein [Bifidobacterium italicum]
MGWESPPAVIGELRLVENAIAYFTPFEQWVDNIVLGLKALKYQRFQAYYALGELKSK